MLNKKLLSVAGVAVLASTSMAQTIFSSAGESLADFFIANGGDSSATVVDYSNFTFNGVTHNLGESGNQIGGSAATTGILLSANETAGVATGINLFLGSTPLNVTASQYTLSFDMYMQFSATGSGTTEEMLWAVGRTSTDAVGRWNGNLGEGTWGYATGEGGSAFDYAINIDGLREQSLNASEALPQATFASPPYDIQGSPGGAWSTVDIVVDNGTVSVYHNDALFFTQDNAPTDGFIVVGYDDPFASLSNDPGNQWMIVDNIEVEVVPEPMTMTMLGVGALALLRRKRKSA